MDLSSAAISSPCIDICTLGRGDICVGCGRHIDEIAVWGSLTPADKLGVIAASRERLAQLQAQQPQVAP